MNLGGNFLEYVTLYTPTNLTHDVWGGWLYNSTTGVYAKQAKYNARLVLPADKVGLRREIDRGKSTAVHVHAMKA